MPGNDLPNSQNRNMPGLHGDRENPLSVSVVVNRIKNHLEPAFSTVYVTGEISDHSVSKGHHYFAIKDKLAKLKVILWASDAERIKCKAKNGLQVSIRGRLDFYPPFGELRLQAQAMIHAGEGDAERALRLLKVKLLGQGYFAKERKRPFPTFPHRIGIVTSTTGAAIRDMLETIARRWSMTEVIVVHAKVQGDGAAREIASAIRFFGLLHRNQHLPIDLLIVGRGGGSKDDLAAFNDEIVADAIFQSPVPVMTGVGHEIDLSIADLVADAHAETPTAAIVQTIPDREFWTRAIGDSLDRLYAATMDRVDQSRLAVQRIADRPVFRKPLERIHDRKNRFVEIERRIQRQIRANLEHSREQLAAVTARLESLSPLNILSRGYSLTFKDEQLLKDAAMVNVGDELTTRLAKGSVVSQVVRANGDRSS